MCSVCIVTAESVSDRDQYCFYFLHQVNVFVTESLCNISMVIHVYILFIGDFFCHIFCVYVWYW